MPRRSFKWTRSQRDATADVLQSGDSVHAAWPKRRRTKKEHMENRVAMEARLTKVTAKLEVQMRVMVFDDEGEIIEIDGPRVRVKFDKARIKTTWCLASVVQAIPKKDAK